MKDIAHEAHVAELHEREPRMLAVMYLLLLLTRGDIRSSAQPPASAGVRPVEAKLEAASAAAWGVARQSRHRAGQSVASPSWSPPQREVV